MLHRKQWRNITFVMGSTRKSWRVQDHLALIQSLARRDPCRRHFTRLMIHLSPRCCRGSRWQTRQSAPCPLLHTWSVFLIKKKKTWRWTRRAQFCFPDDIRIVSTRRDAPKPPTTHHTFILTDETGARRYGVCITTWQPLPRRLRRQYRRKVKAWIAQKWVHCFSWTSVL